MSQQRQFPRYAVEATVTLRHDGNEVVGRTSNLSRGGLCAMVPTAVPVGIAVQMGVALIFDDDNLSESLDLYGRVVWCTAVEDRFQVGLSFAPVKPETIKYLELFLKYLAEGRRLGMVAANGDDPFGD